MGKAYQALLESDYKAAVENKKICLSSLDKLNSTNVNDETENSRKLLRNLVEAFLPVEQQTLGGKFIEWDEKLKICTF